MLPWRGRRPAGRPTGACGRATVLQTARRPRAHRCRCPLLETPASTAAVRPTLTTTTISATASRPQPGPGALPGAESLRASCGRRAAVVVDAG